MRRLAALACLWLVWVAAAAGAAEPRVAIRWLGVAGFAIEADGSVLLHDPYLSRPGLLRTLLFSYEPDVAGPDAAALGRESRS